MDALTAAEEAGRPLNRIGAARFGEEPELQPLIDRHGYAFVYLAGRTSPLGGGAQLATAGAVFFPAVAVRAALDAVAATQLLDEFAAEYAGACASLGARRWGGHPDAEELAELLAQLVANIDFSARPMAAAWADQPRPENAGSSIEQSATILREFRADGHVHVLAAHGLGALDAVLFNALWKGRDPAKSARFFGWRDEAAIEAAWARLASVGRVDGDRTLTPEGREERDAIETLTTGLASAPWEDLHPDDRHRTVELLHALADA